MQGDKGFFITFEGVDGSGKSTQVALLEGALKLKGIDILATCEPQKGGRVRELLVSGKGTFSPEQEAQMMFEDRQDHLQNKVLPALEKGQWVISDRFADSSRAYQGYGLGVEMSHIDSLYKKYVGDFKPDLTIILDIDPKEGLSRSFKRNGANASNEDKYEKLGLEFQQKLRKGYLEIAEKDKDRCVVVESSGDVQKIHNKIIGEIEKRFGNNLKKNVKLKPNKFSL